nr:TonB-dependent copper receptor [Luteimonas aquatica]
MSLSAATRSPPAAPAARPAVPVAALAAALALALPPRAAAHEDAPETRLLDTVVVTAAAPSASLVFETDPRLPRQPVPASDGADYLKTIPGFTAVRNGGSNGDPVLRGMFGSRLNLLSNDGAMPGACPARMDNPMSYVAPETYDRLVVIKGPQTVQWGPGASAGTVRFVREPETFDAPGLRVRGSLLAGANGRNDQTLDATAGAPRGYVRVGTNRSQADDYRDGAGDLVPSLWKKWSADASFGWTPDRDTLLEATVGAGDGQARYAGRGMDGVQFRRSSYALRFEKTRIGGALDALQANAYVNDADHVMDNYSLRDPNPMGPMPMAMVSNVDRRTSGGRAAATWKVGAWEIVTGLDAQRSRHRERNAMHGENYRAMAWQKDADFSNLGAFAEATWRLAARERLVAGARVDRARVRDARPVAGMMGMPNPTAGQRRRDMLRSGFLRFERTLAGDAATGPALTWYAGLGHAERMPDYWELFSPNLGPPGAANAFAGVQPERTTQIDLGLQYRGARASAWISAYAGRIQDYILFTYREGGMMGMTSRVANVDAAIRGGEAGVAFRPAPDWKLEGTLAYAWGEQRATGAPLPQMPPLDARLSLAYDDRTWSFGALLRGVAAQHRVSVEQGNVVGRDLGRSAGFATVAVNAGYRFDERLVLTAGIDNLFDRDYSEHLNLSGSADFGYPADPVRIHEPGRTGWMKLTYAY